VEKTGWATNTKTGRATHISGPPLYTIPCNHKERFHRVILFCLYLGDDDSMWPLVLRQLFETIAQSKQTVPKVSQKSQH